MRKYVITEVKNLYEALYNSLDIISTNTAYTYYENACE